MRTITVKDRQSLLDLSVQYCGDVQSVFDFALLNGLSITEELKTGMQLQAPPPAVKRIADYFRINGFEPATADFSAYTGEEGIEFWAIEVDFVIS